MDGRERPQQGGRAGTKPSTRVVEKARGLQPQTAAWYPPNSGRRLAGCRHPEQVFIDGDANSAGIANRYIQQILRRFARKPGELRQRAAYPGSFSTTPPTSSLVSLCRG